MDVKELRQSLGNGLFDCDSNEVVIQLEQPSVAVSAHTGIQFVFPGYDWDAGKLLISPSTPLVSWEYLEKIHPGIREEIEQDRKNYEHRPIRCIVAGSRNIGFSHEDRKEIKNQLEALVCTPYITYNNIEIISGCAAGVDSESAKIAQELGYSIKEFPANWDMYGTLAGAIRNKQMADYASENDSLYRGMLIAFWDGESPGTKNMIETAIKCGLNTRIYQKDTDNNTFEKIFYNFEQD